MREYICLNCGSKWYSAVFFEESNCEKCEGKVVPTVETEAEFPDYDYTGTNPADDK